jgi:hypothetical protein
VDLDSDLGLRSSNRLAFGVTTVAIIILETFDIVRNKIVKITGIFEQLKDLRKRKFTCWSERMGRFWFIYPISYK